MSLTNILQSDEKENLADPTKKATVDSRSRVSAGSSHSSRPTLPPCLLTRPTTRQIPDSASPGTDSTQVLGMVASPQAVRAMVAAMTSALAFRVSPDVDVLHLPTAMTRTLARMTRSYLPPRQRPPPLLLLPTGGRSSPLAAGNPSTGCSPPDVSRSSPLSASERLQAVATSSFSACHIPSSSANLSPPLYDDTRR